MEKFSSGLKNASRAALAAGLLSLVACNPDDPMTDCNYSTYKEFHFGPNCAAISANEGGDLTPDQKLAIPSCDEIRIGVRERMMSTCVTKEIGQKTNCHATVNKGYAKDDIYYLSFNCEETK